MNTYFFTKAKDPAADLRRHEKEENKLRYLIARLVGREDSRSVIIRNSYEWHLSVLLKSKAEIVLP